MVNKCLVPENLDWFRRMLVYRGAGLGRFHCTFWRDHHNWGFTVYSYVLVQSLMHVPYYPFWKFAPVELWEVAYLKGWPLMMGDIIFKHELYICNRQSWSYKKNISHHNKGGLFWGGYYILTPLYISTLDMSYYILSVMKCDVPSASLSYVCRLQYVAIL